ncbi:hypothetical protein [Janthinobacterium sp. SUN206]|uniref:hypothetical protein n=1 Tax=Janthinobacterium sp. SUN206 TaxID=3014787 RepID=UPI00271310F3|nr:hypothetical protein [Janthinobacterium sp. SUN206]MDO8064650.1 hypothetical protein [Janthinobacterium sp. SUN206]
MGFIKQALLALLLCAMSAAHATHIGYTATALGGTQWRYDYTVSNTTLGVPIGEFTLFFSVGRYANLHKVSTAPGWDVLLVQPDPAIPASGYLDALALAGGINPGATATGFSVTFDYLGAGSPGAQPFSILDPVSFIELDSGSTQPAAIALPSTPWLLLAGVLAMLCLRRRQLAAAVLAPLLTLSLCACGGSNDPTQPPTPKVMLAADADTLGPDTAVPLAASADAGQAAGPFTVTALRKVGEQRINRRTYDYTFRISIRNNGSEAASNVRAILASVPAGAGIVDDSVLAGGIDAGATVTPDDTITLRIDRTRPFELGGLAWNITSGASVALDPVRPAQVVSLPLAELGFPAGADKVAASGAVTDVLLKDGSLRFSTPGDTGEDQHAQFFVTKGNIVTTLDLLIQSELPTALQVYVEPLENGSLPPAPPKLAIGGLGPNNTLQPGGLSFRLEGVAPMNLRNDSGGFLAAQSGAPVAIHSYWVFHADTGSFSISATAMQQLLNVLPAGALQLHLNFVTQDGEFAVSYALTVIKAATVLQGQMRTPAGGNASGLAGKKILLTGYNFHLRRVAVIDAAGAFHFDGVIPDTYQLTLNDLDHPNVVGISTAIFPTSTIVNVSITYPYAGVPGLQAATAPWTAAAVTQDGAAPPARQAAQAMAVPAPATPQAEDEDGTQSFTATAGPQNQTVVRPFSYTVPKGTQDVGVKITVRTAEYPTYTTQQSQYNDTWSYVVVGLPGVDLASMGAVNQSHFTQGTTVRTECVDVSQQTRTGPLVITGAASATNIGDSLLATLTTVELSLACKGLKITRARLFPINADLHPVLQPRNLTHNLPGPYVSVPQNTPDRHTISLEVRYSPERVNLTEVNIGMSADGANPAFSTVNLLDQANIRGKDRITFPRLRLPDFPGPKIDRKAVLTVRLKGRVGNANAVSDPAEGGQVALKGDTAFIPLYLAHNEAALAKRRYGPRDDGGDSWATRLTIAWLAGKPYRFNDISGQHVTQEASGRSILDHDGHSDGQQIDMRYADGAGGYSDELGGLGNGAAILQLINDAEAEVAAGLPKKPKLARLGAWITANRAMLTLEAGAASTRVVYIGHRFIKLALIDGCFASPPHARIPGVPVWTKPLKVSIDPSHLHHWHLSMTAHP